MLYYIQITLMILFICSVSGFIMTVLKEKLLLRNMTLVIDSKSVTDKELEDLDQFLFELKKEIIKSGDEIKIVTKEKRKLAGIVIGLKEEDQLIMVTYKDEIVHLKIDEVSKLKVTSRYGKFFS